MSFLIKNLQIRKNCKAWKIYLMYFLSLCTGVRNQSWPSSFLTSSNRLKLVKKRKENVTTITDKCTRGVNKRLNLKTGKKIELSRPISLTLWTITESLLYEKWITSSHFIFFLWKTWGIYEAFKERAKVRELKKFFFSPNFSNILESIINVKSSFLWSKSFTVDPRLAMVSISVVSVTAVRKY